MIATTEMKSLKEKLKATWEAGNFDRIARTFAPGAAQFIVRQSLRPGERVLDVACGSGNLSFPAARAGAIVTGVDIATNLIETARARAVAEGMNIQFDEGDAEHLPYENESFDVVVSMFGAMFAPRPELVAAELKRVCRHGGRIAMANWTPEGFIGQMFKLTAAHVPPPMMPSPLLWGREEIVNERLREGVSDLQLSRRIIAFRLPMTPVETVEYFRAWYGPTQRAFAALDETRQAALRRDLEHLWTDHNRATDGTTLVEAEYLEVAAVQG
ncbi:MAG: class I SAM-dependent methyltransferase [Acidobacteria bacterium]|nr:class I SAM-dependent methyltransferase [Acidobacteriota bacterium]